MMTAEQLKGSILQLALSGRLIPQDKTDESAQILLNRIREKKKVLIKAKVVPKEKKMDDVSEDEQLFDIPDNWVWTRIGELFQHNTGKALNGSNKEGTVLPYITTSNLYWNRFELDNLKEMPFTDAEMEKCTATKGDLLVCEGGDYGRAAIWNYDFDIRIQNHVHKLRAYEELCTEYFYYLFNFLKSTGQIKGKGIAIQGLSSGALHNLVVPLPPLNEQYRIVEKLYEIIPVWEKYAAASTKLNTLNASFPEMMKKSILQEAVQGKLVPQDPNDEPASVLLEKIAEEKKRLIKEGKIKKDKKEKYIYRRENSWWEVRDSIEVCLDQELPFDIPGTWSWVHLSNICETIFDIDHKMPKAVDKDHGVLFLSAKDLIDDGTINYEHNVKYISHDDAERLSKKGKPRRGDILYSRIGACLGKARIIDRDVELIASYSCCTIRLIDQRLTNYLQMIMDGGFVLSQARDKTQSIGVPDLGMQMIKDFFIPIPPLEEQKRIYEKYESIYKQVDSLWK